MKTNQKNNRENRIFKTLDGKYALTKFEDPVINIY